MAPQISALVQQRTAAQRTFLQERNRLLRKTNEWATGILASYDAARADRLTQDWSRTILSADQELQMAGPNLRARSRELARNDPNMAKYLRLVVKNLVGPYGFKLQSRVMLQRGGRPNKKVNSIIEGGFTDWGRKRTASVAEDLSFLTHQKLAARCCAMDGEFFLRFRLLDRARNPYQFALQVIDPDQVDHTFWGKLASGNDVRLGVEKDPDGRVVAYHVFNHHPSEYGSAPRQRVRIPASEMLHLFLPVYVGQSRGIPWAAASMYRMNLLKGYEDAAVVASRLAALFSFAIEKDLPKDINGQPFDDADKAELTNGGEQIELQSGMGFPLRPGEKIQAIAPNHPTG